MKNEILLLIAHSLNNKSIHDPKAQQVSGLKVVAYMDKSYREEKVRKLQGPGKSCGFLLNAHFAKVIEFGFFRPEYPMLNSRMVFDQMSNFFLEIEKNRTRLKSIRVDPDKRRADPINEKINLKSIKTILSIFDVSKNRFLDEIYDRQNAEILSGRVENIPSFIWKTSKEMPDIIEIL